MASSTSFTFLFSLSFTFFHPYFPSFTFIFLRTSSFAFINLHLRSLFLIHLHSNSFTFIHTHPSSLIFIHLHRPSFTFAFFHLHLPSSSSISLHLPPVAFIHLHSLAFLYLHTPTSTTISLHLPSSTSVGFHDSPEIIQRIVAPSQYSFLINLFPCPLVFRHYTYSKKILHFRETYRILHCFVMKQGLNEVYILPTSLISHLGHKIFDTWSKIVANNPDPWSRENRLIPRFNSVLRTENWMKYQIKCLSLRFLVQFYWSHHLLTGELRLAPLCSFELS